MDTCIVMSGYTIKPLYVRLKLQDCMSHCTYIIFGHDSFAAPPPPPLSKKANHIALHMLVGMFISRVQFAFTNVWLYHNVIIHKTEIARLSRCTCIIFGHDNFAPPPPPSKKEGHIALHISVGWLVGWLVGMFISHALCNRLLKNTLPQKLQTW